MVLRSAWIPAPEPESVEGSTTEWEEGEEISDEKTGQSDICMEGSLPLPAMVNTIGGVIAAVRQAREE